MGNHAAEDNLVLLNALDIPINTKNILYKTTEDEKDFAKIFLESINHQYELSLIGLIPSGGWESKRCDPDKWIEICNEINKSYNVKYLILWDPEMKKMPKPFKMD